MSAAHVQLKNRAVAFQVNLLIRGKAFVNQTDADGFLSVRVLISYSADLVRWYVTVFFKDSVEY